MKKTKVLNAVVPIMTFVFIIVVWITAGAIVNNEYLLPSIPAVWNALKSVFSDGKFYSAYLSTLLRSLIAFLISFILALGCGILCKRYSLFEKFIAPFIKIARALPTVAIVLILIFWTNAQVTPVVVTMLVVFPTLFISVKDSLNTVDKGQIEMCSLFGVSQKDIFFSVQLPQIAPSMLSSVGAGLSLNLKLMVAAEVLAATYISLGNVLNVYKYNAEIASMIAVVAICVITGLLIELVFNILSKKAGKWQ